MSTKKESQCCTACREHNNGRNHPRSATRSAAPRAMVNPPFDEASAAALYDAVVYGCGCNSPWNGVEVIARPGEILPGGIPPDTLLVSRRLADGLGARLRSASETTALSSGMRLPSTMVAVRL